MKPNAYNFKVQGEAAGQTLIDFLSTELPPALGVAVSKSKIRMLIFAGAVYVDGKRVQKVNYLLPDASDVQTYVDLKRLQKDKPSQQKKVELQASDICYEDREIIIVNKPAGLPTQATVDNNRDHLYAAVIRFLNAREGKETYVGLHHRLDYDTSGLILFTKMKSANLWVSELFKKRQITKTYHAITERKKRKIGDTWEIKNHIARAKKKGGGRVIHMEEVVAGGDLAHTTFKVLKENSELQFLECHPHTGRTHQIRLHLKLSGQPILGDVLYGGTKAERIFLHATKLEFKHGTTEKKLTIEAPYPPEFKSMFDKISK